MGSCLVRLRGIGRWGLVSLGRKMALVTFRLSLSRTVGFILGFSLIDGISLARVVAVLGVSGCHDTWEECIFSSFSGLCVCSESNDITYYVSYISMSSSLYLLVPYPCNHVLRLPVYLLSTKVPPQQKLVRRLSRWNARAS